PGGLGGTPPPCGSLRCPTGKRSRPRDEARAAAASSTFRFWCTRRSGRRGSRRRCLSREAGARRQQLLAMDAYSRHKMLVLRRAATLTSKGTPRATSETSTSSGSTTGSCGTAASEEAGSWEQRLAKRYWTKLYKEYCIADLRGYKEGRVGLRWAHRAEVLSGRGSSPAAGKRCEQLTPGQTGGELSLTEGGETKKCAGEAAPLPGLLGTASTIRKTKAEADRSRDRRPEDEVLAGIRASGRQKSKPAAQAAGGRPARTR
uniref:AP2/ERF domain-containing protein n=1 Tax=Macrostomum lignano TaxID=282301 RepID=A0A1I8FE58_9PLAT